MKYCVSENGREIVTADFGNFVCMNNVTGLLTQLNMTAEFYQEVMGELRIKRALLDAICGGIKQAVGYESASV